MLWRALVTKVRVQNSGGQFFPSCREKIFRFPPKGKWESFCFYALPLFFDKLRNNSKPKSVMVVLLEFIVVHAKCSSSSFNSWPITHSESSKFTPSQPVQARSSNADVDIPADQAKATTGGSGIKFKKLTATRQQLNSLRLRSGGFFIDCIPPEPLEVRRVSPDPLFSRAEGGAWGSGQRDYLYTAFSTVVSNAKLCVYACCFFCCCC